MIKEEEQFAGVRDCDCLALQLQVWHQAVLGRVGLAPESCVQLVLQQRRKQGVWVEMVGVCQASAQRGAV